MKRILLSLGLLLALLSTVAAPAMAELTAEQELGYVDAFRYRYDTLIEVRYLATTRTSAPCDTTGKCTCNAEYQVIKPLRIPKEHEAMQKGDKINLEFKCRGFKAVNPYSPNKWGSRLPNRNILIEVPWYLLENTDQNTWMLGRNRGFVPLYPRNLSW